MMFMQFLYNAGVTLAKLDNYSIHVRDVYCNEYIRTDKERRGRDRERGIYTRSRLLHHEEKCSTV